MEQSSCLKEIRFSEDPTTIQDHPARGEEHNDVQGERDGSQQCGTLTDFGAPFKVPVVPFGTLFLRTSQGLHQFGEFHLEYS